MVCMHCLRYLFIPQIFRLSFVFVLVDIVSVGVSLLKLNYESRNIFFALSPDQNTQKTKKKKKKKKKKNNNNTGTQKYFSV